MLEGSQFLRYIQILAKQKERKNKENIVKILKGDLFG